MAGVLFKPLRETTFVNRGFYGKTLVLDVFRANPQKMLWLQGKRFIKEKQLVESLVQPGAHIVDVGANIGYYTLMFSSLAGKNCRIWSIEPDPVNLRELEASIVASNLTEAVTIIPKAAGSQDGVVRFEPGLNSHVTPDGRSEIPITRLDSLEVGHIDLIKIDVEGYEGAVLEGANEIILRCKPSIFMELHPHLLTEHSHSAILALLQEHFSDVKAYSQERDSAFARLLQSYGLVESVKEISSLDEVIEGYKNGQMIEPCWIVARP